MDFLEDELKKIRIAKYFTDIPFVIFILSCVCFFILKSFDAEAGFKPIYQMSFFLFLVGFIMLFYQEAIKCPNCGKKFNVKINGASHVRNLFSRKCMNCGLKVSGNNIGDYRNRQ